MMGIVHDAPQSNDNRDYDYSGFPTTSRIEYPVISDWISEQSRVLDLGCGNGSLLAFLRDRRRTSGLGIELSPSGVIQARAKGLDVREGRIDVPLVELPDDSFDVAVCNVTLQMVMYPETLLREMRRLAPTQIVSFPNFAVIHNRLDCLLSGRMPRPMLHGYRWYDTGHIHQLSLRDFRGLASEVGLVVVDACYRTGRGAPLRLLSRMAPNLFSSCPILKLVRA